MSKPKHYGLLALLCQLVLHMVRCAMFGRKEGKVVPLTDARSGDCRMRGCKGWPRCGGPVDENRFPGGFAVALREVCETKSTRTGPWKALLDSNVSTRMCGVRDGRVAEAFDISRSATAAHARAIRQHQDLNKREGELCFFREASRVLRHPTDYAMWAPSFRVWKQDIVDANIVRLEAAKRCDSKLARNPTAKERVAAFDSLMRGHWRNGTTILFFGGTEINFVLDLFEAKKLQRPHTAFLGFNENYGDLSQHIRGRTVDWGTLSKTLRAQGRTLGDLRRYLDSPALRFLVTTQHQEISHPKAISVPLGLKAERRAQGFFAELERLRGADLGASAYPRKTRLLFINFQCTNDNYRHNVSNVLEQRFGAFNTYSLLSMKEFYHGMARSKFVLCPSGLGLESYRVWEALLLGAIPVMERMGGGWMQTFDGLPVLWVDSFTGLTKGMLEQHYGQLITDCRAGAFHFERLTRRWWIDRVCGETRCWEQRRGDTWEDQDGALTPCDRRHHCCA